MSELIFQVTSEEKLGIEKLSEIHENEFQNNLIELKNWLTEQHHLPQNQNDKLLITVLRLNKNNLDKTKKKLDMFYSIRNIVPEFYDSRDIFSEAMQNTMNNFIFMPLPNLMPITHERVYITRLSTANIKHFDLKLMAKLIFSVYDLRAHYDTAPGEVFVVDMAQMGFSHVVRINPVVLKRMYYVLERGYSDRIKGIHYINLFSFANVIINMVKLILNDKIAGRVHAHNNLESLHKYIPKEILPKDYGGTLEAVDKIEVDWRKFMEEKNNWLIDQGNQRSDESLRPKPQKANTEGSFGNMFGLFGKSQK